MPIKIWSVNPLGFCFLSRILSGLFINLLRPSMWGDFISQAQSLASSLESNLNESVGLTTGLTTKPPEEVPDKPDDFSTTDNGPVINSTKIEQKQQFTSTADTPTTNTPSLPYTPDSIHDAQSAPPSKHPLISSLPSKQSDTSTLQRNMKEDMAREVDCPSNPSESPAGSPSASSPAHTSQPCTSPQPSFQPSVPICDVTSQLSTLTQRLSASEAEAQLWKSRAMKLKTSATSTPAKSSSSEAAYDELAKEAQGMNEKIHVLTGRVRALNKEKADLVKEKEKLEETITKVKEEKVKVRMAEIHAGDSTIKNF